MTQRTAVRSAGSPLRALGMATRPVRADLAVALDRHRSELPERVRVQAGQERLKACSYAMAHPESDLLVPACVQHAVFDQEANRRVARRLPRSVLTRA